MKRILAPLVLITLTLGMVGCGSPTKYEPTTWRGGFSDIQLDTNVYRVTFEGNSRTNATRAEDLALLRSAELSLSKGYSFFVIIDGKTRVDQTQVVNPVQTFSTTEIKRNERGRPKEKYTSTTTYGGDTTTYSMPSTINTIMLFHKRPDMNTVIYDAKLLCNSLGAKYQVICAAR